MIRRQMLRLLGLVPPALLGISCKDKLPTTPTIVRGKIIDENGDPLEGAGLRLSGVNLKGFSGYDTFSITTESDKNGMYELSQVAPQDTEQIDILPRTTDKVPLNIGIGDYVSYFLVEGNYEKITSPHFIPRSDWGKTITLNYQFRKR
ncbi:carboxypeptidase-like regulatory domain-containing protein [Dyadobacter helix]|nr:carboxypeptidase-like regulatory domain-containing protein [Dyadobacter sp. CECT 9275]